MEFSANRADTILHLPYPSASTPIWFKASFKHTPSPGMSVPLRLHVSGPATAFIFLNGVMLGKYYEKDGPQEDFYLFDGLVKEDNDLIILSYDGRSRGYGGISFEVCEWRMSDWSGNVDEEGAQYYTKRQLIIL
jgi:hypothetical protein